MHFIPTFLFFSFPLKGIAPITVVTHRDILYTEEQCENALFEASAASGSSRSHTFFVANYTKDRPKRDPETERMIFDILHSALLTAERTVKIMKQKIKDEEEDDMKRLLEGTCVSGLVAPDSQDGKQCVIHPGWGGGEMMRLLEGSSVSGQVAPDSPDGKQGVIHPGWGGVDAPA